MARVNIEAFQLIEKYDGMTAEELSRRLGMKFDSARQWLSNWKSRGYLISVKLEKPQYGRNPGPCRYMYIINPQKSWIDYVYNRQSFL